MKRSVSAFPGVCGLAMMTLALLACSDDTTSGPQPGVATVAFAPRSLTIPYIDLSSARLRLDRLEIIGNVPPPPPNRPPPDEPPPRLPGIDLDALSEGTSATIEDLPQGLYSRVRFLLGRVTLEGTVQATRFHVTLPPFGRVRRYPRVDSPGARLRAGHRLRGHGRPQFLVSPWPVPGRDAG